MTTDDIKNGFVFKLLTRISDGLAARRILRAKHFALTSLLAMDTHRLDDLGISRQDVLDAVHARSGARHLEARRRVRTAGAPVRLHTRATA